MNSIFVTENSKSCRKKNAQFYYCKRENLPFVVIRPGRKYASVEIDMFTTDRNLDEEAEADICKALFEYSELPGEIWHSRISCRAVKVLKTKADALAMRIYQIAYDAMPRLKHCGGVDKPLVRGGLYPVPAGRLR